MSDLIVIQGVLSSRDVRWPKFVGMGLERNAFPFKKELSFSSFFSFFSLSWNGFLDMKSDAVIVKLV